MSKLKAENLQIHYGSHHAVRDVTVEVPDNAITAFIGPSGCGKSSVLRCFNRLNDLIPGFRLDGDVRFEDDNLYARHIDPVEVRRRIGMVFQKSNPFPKSIYDNVAFAARMTRYDGDMDEPTSALDPVSTERIEELMLSLKQDYTIAIVTHSLPQARRVSDVTVFLNTEERGADGIIGYLAESAETEVLFENPQLEVTKAYVTGRFG